MHYRQWLALNDDQKMVYYLGLAECTVPLLHGSPHIAFIREALDACWHWLTHREIHPADFYHYFEDEETKDSLLMLMQDENDEVLLAAWICITESVGFILYNGFKHHHHVQPPSTEGFELSGEIFDSFAQNFQKIFPAVRTEQLETQMFALLAAAPDDIFDKDWVLARLNAAS